MNVYVLVKTNSCNNAYDYPSFNSGIKFNVKCKELYHFYGLYANVYKLLLKGTEKNIESYLCYLKSNGFEIKKY